MKECQELLDLLEGPTPLALSTELREHLEQCPACRQAVARWQALGEAAELLAQAPPPAALVESVKRLPRFAPACEATLEGLGDALAGTLPARDRTRFLTHLQGCPSCRATWEALATLREVGRAARAPAALCALAALPPRQRLALRRRRGVFDVRLAVAAAYLFAALTVALVGSPQGIAEQGAALARAGTYLEAAVDNRLASIARRFGESASATAAWAWDAARASWEQLQQLFAGRGENRREEQNV